MNKELAHNLDVDIVSPASEPSGVGISERAEREEISLAAEYDYRRQQQELGWIGRIFGGRHHAPTYAVGMIALVALIGLLGVGASSAVLREELFKVLGAIVIAALGYLGGTHTTRS